MKGSVSRREGEYQGNLFYPLIEACRSENSWEEIAANCRLTRSGDPMSWVFALDEGIIAWRACDRQGRPALLTWYDGPSVIGIPEVLLGTEAPADLVTLTQCKLVRVPGPTFRALVSELDDFLLRTIVHRLASEVYTYMLRIRSLQLLNADEMFLDYLREQVTRVRPLTNERVRRVGLPLTHAQMAEWLGVSPQYFSQILARLEEEGVLRREKGWLLVQEDLVSKEL
ncbi:MAG TPA: Crp/Fnr family transcriptional regulator [Acidobacteriota bacterium]|nr:Crp/Fnr family transcriptional regulator [Acidobacteriota bacterium]HRR26104.1 Crp/Fnr family transcriptional regulator [Acidobacteriota bacterium]HRR55956.1 Crp/Fnr family transcriptional regulator [Acidobacteriota bacterium]HRV08736.1 Crp/Fnr family transcriptional regulator [Acidobacteriota bacterium]